MYLCRTPVPTCCTLTPAVLGCGIQHRTPPLPFAETLPSVWTATAEHTAVFLRQHTVALIRTLANTLPTTYLPTTFAHHPPPVLTNVSDDILITTTLPLPYRHSTHSHLDARALCPQANNTTAVLPPDVLASERWHGADG